MNKMFFFSAILCIFASGMGMAKTSGQIQISQGATAHEGKTDHPQGCLPSWPKIVHLSGTLGTTTYPGDPSENPPIPEEIFLFLHTAKPISTCAFTLSKSVKIPSYVEVHQIGMGWWSLAASKLIMSKWGSDRVRLTGALYNAAGTGSAPGNVIIWPKSICFIKSHKNQKCTKWKTFVSNLRKQVNVVPGN